MSYSRVQSKQRAKRKRRWPAVAVSVLMLALILGVGFYAASVAGGGGDREQQPPIGSPNGTEPSGTEPAPSPQGSPNSQPDSPSAEPTDSEEPDASASPAVGEGGAEPTSSPDESTPSPSEAVPDTGTADESTGTGTQGNAVTLAFVGDILPASGVGKLMEQNGVDYPFKLAKPILEAADIAAGNLEAPITTRGTPAANKQYVFKGKPEYLEGLKNAGLDVLSLANNHTLDQGWEGLSDTMDALDDIKLKHMGSGADDKEAFAPVYLEHDGITVAYIGVSNVVPDGSWKAGPNHPGVAETYDTTRAVATVKEARKLADIVVVMVHWGNERADTPKKAQFDVGHTLVDAGADLVIGSHPHVLQGFEAYKGKWIAYSLGNFVFTTKQEGYSKTQDTGVLTATCKAGGRCDLKFSPMYAKASQPGPMEPEQAQALISRLNKASYGAAIGSDGRIKAK